MRFPLNKHAPLSPPADRGRVANLAARLSAVVFRSSALLALFASLLLTAAPAAARQSPEQFDARRAFEHVKRQVEFGPRPAGSEALARARRHITGELKSYGLKVSADEFTAQTPVGRRRMVNVTAELPGESADFIILAGHYDTKLFDRFRFVGANDGGSSTGVLLELARVLAAAPRRNHFTYRFVFFDGEESFCRHWDTCSRPGAPDNTYGSRRYVARLRETGELRRARSLVLLDMVGYRDLELGRDPTSTRWLVDLVWETARGIGHGAQFVGREENVGQDDHTPFLAAGVPAVDIIQLDTFPHWHTAEDTLDKISPESLRAVGRTVLASLPRIEARLRGAGRAPEGSEGEKVKR
ncbi:MAG TPA: M28 family peptidase [Pyrinomonadaceae bacterium]|nr:M28 family peptidase [Pyrinomonadaceae bacterium]